MAIKKEKVSLFDFEASEVETTSYEDYEQMKSYQLEEGVEFTGTPIINLYENEDKKYDSIRLRLVDDEMKQLLDCYINIPKKDKNNNIGRLSESFSFYHTAFNFVKKTIEIIDGANLEKIKQFNRTNLKNILDVYENAEIVSIKITNGHPNDDYNSFIVTEIG